MRKKKLTAACQTRFLEALADSGSVSAAVAVAGTSRTRVYELRKADLDFARAWEDAEEIAADRLHDEARRRALEGIPEPLVSGGKRQWSAVMRDRARRRDMVVSRGPPSGAPREAPGYSWAEPAGASSARIVRR